MDLMDCQSFLLLKKKITETDELITKCQFLQNKLELVRVEQAKQQMELKSMENENALLQSAKRKYESQLHHHMGTIKGYENTIKQCSARINELEKLQEKDSALIKTLQAERDTAVSENRKVVSSRVRNVKARSKQTQTELLVDMGSEGRIIIPSFQVNCRQRRRRSSQAVSSSTEARELICKTPTIILPPAERSSTPKSSCSEGDGSSGGEDITENEMPWLTEITEQPVETAMCDVTHAENEWAEINKQAVETPVCDIAYSESELDESSENLLLPYSAMDMSISPLPPTPSMNLDGESTRRIDTSKDIGTELDHNTSECDLLKECHLTSDSSVVLDNDNETIEESTLISSHQLSNDSDSVVVASDSANLLLEKASGSPILRTLNKESHDTYSGRLDADEEACKSSTLCSHESPNMATPPPVEAPVLNPSKSLVVPSSPPAGAPVLNPSKSLVALSSPPAEAPVLNSPELLIAPSPPSVEAPVLNSPKMFVAPSPPPAESPVLNSPKLLVAPSPPSVEAPVLNSPKTFVAPSPPPIETSVLKSPKSLETPSSCSKPSDLPTVPTVPVFVSHVPTGLTSPVALRTGFSKGAKDKNTYPSFMVDPRRESTINPTFKKDNKLNTAKRIGSLNRRSSPQSGMYFSSIAERTRSQAPKSNNGSLQTPKVTKQAKRQLNKLEITMNAFKSYQSSPKIQNKKDIDAIQNHEANINSILSVDRYRKNTGKRKRALNQPRTDLKKKCYIANNCDLPSKGRNFGRVVSGKLFGQQTPLPMDRVSKNYKKGDKIKHDDEMKSIENDDDLDTVEAGIELNISEGELDKSEASFDENNEDLDNREIAEKSDGKQKGVNDRRKLSEIKKDDAALEEKTEGNHEEDKNVVESAKAKQVNNEGDNVDEEKLNNIEDEGSGGDKCTISKEDREIDKNMFENESLEEMSIDVNERESDQQRNEVENMDSSSENGELVVKDSVEEEYKEEERKNVVESESRREVENAEEVGNEGKLGEGEVQADKSEVDNEETMQKDESKGGLDDSSGSKDKLEDKSKGEMEENRSDGELDSEEDPFSSSSNQMPETTLNASPKIRPKATMSASPKIRPKATISASPKIRPEASPKISASLRKKQDLFMKDKPASKLSTSATAPSADEDVFDPSCSLLKDTKLPGWLEWTINEEEKASTTMQHSFVKGQKRKRGKNRRMKSQAQKTVNYLLVNLEHLLLKSLKFEKVLDMFSDPCNVDNTSDFASAISKFIVEALHPSFENVASKLAERCNKAVSHNAKIFPHYKPLDENFHPVMLTFESRIVAMLMILEKGNPKLNNLMGCVADTLRCTLFVSLEDNNIDVHKQCSLIRVITAISRSVGKVDFMQRLCLDLISLSRPLKISQLPLLQAVAGVWPLVLARKEGVKLYGIKEVIPEGLEPQIVSHTVEVTTCYLIAKQDSQEFGHLLFKTFVSFCKWQQLSEASMRSLATALVKILTSSPNVTLNSYDSANQGKWISPQLSATTHMCITCLAVIGKYLGWKWISDSLIREQLWPLLQKWSRKTIGQEVSEPVITAITQLIGLVGKQGVLHDPASQSVRQLQKMLSSLLQRAHDSPEVTLSIQLAVAESLISLCHPSQLPVAKEVLQRWLTGIKTHHPYAAQTIWEDFAPRVWSMRTITNDSTSEEKTY